MKVVLDTNVLVSGVFFTGIPLKIMQSWLDYKYQVYATPLILEEYIRVINYLSLKHNPLFHQNWNSILPNICHVIEDQDDVKICRDPHDNKFLSCAQQSRSNFLVSGDKDLNSIASKFTFRIVSPREFVNVLNK